MDQETEREAWIRLALAELPPRVTASALAGPFGGAVGLLHASTEHLATRLGTARARYVQRALASAKPREILRRAAEAGQRVLTPVDDAWPAAAFQGLTDPPSALFVRGRLPGPSEVGVAIVGTRDATPYRLRVAREIAVDLAQAGLWVISGFAVGVDGAAHAGALEGGGPTLAVLGCGLDYAYPLAHADLKDEVALAGGLLGEYRPGTAPQKWFFPQRNRLVAALSAAVVVVEAPARSGALITARLALDLGREILAVPGSVFGTNRAGCHRLLRQGAALCEGAEDVLAVLGLEAQEARARRAAPTGEPQGLLWSLLDDAEALDAGELCRRTGLGAADVTAALTALELDGYVQRLPGVGFLRR